MYEFYAPTKIIFGEGCLSETIPQIKKMGATCALLVTGRSSTASSAGFKSLCKELDAGGLRWAHFAEVSADPETTIVDRGAEIFRAKGCDAIIGFGGGSPIDCAKGIAASVAEGRSIRDFVGTGLAFSAPVSPLVAIPTTAGTGTEVTNAAVFTVVDENGHRSKKGTSSQFYFPRLAVVDPLLHASMPPSLTAATGMDALTHAVEAYVSRFHTPLSDMYCLEAIRRIGRSLRTACRGSGIDAVAGARSDMAMAATLAGVALSQAGLGMVHGFAHPIGAMTGLAHGLANAILLPFVMNALIPDAGERLSSIGQALTGKSGISAKESVRAIARLGRDIGIPENLEAAGVPETYFENILTDALSYRRRKASPHAFTDAELRALLERMYGGNVEA
ncbi:Alcohol dehydrogenase [uncultured spirochete]|jgi:alcohol dehydrogenase class IV|uniref:Alcohol dehydrogenase n=1 Tax=uncultured spirochete TaxID=156406 RepID=A0A3P3XQF6_9SPIR|nr:Alcohol dehydrogenase [uncultured spirochete]